MKVIVKISNNGQAGIVRKTKDGEFTLDELISAVSAAAAQIPGYTPGAEPIERDYDRSKAYAEFEDGSVAFDPYEVVKDAE